MNLQLRKQEDDELKTMVTTKTEKEDKKYALLQQSLEKDI